MPAPDRPSSPTPARRALLRAGATALPVALAGCSLFESPERHSVEVFNVRESAHRIEVFVRGNEDTLFERTYHLDAGKGAEGGDFEGPPEETAVHVDGERLAAFEWRPNTNEQFRELHPNGCSERTSTVLEVYLAAPGEYDGNGLDSGGEGIYWTYDCATVSG